MRKKDDMAMVDDKFLQLDEAAEDDFDRELNEMIMKSQQRLQEMQSDLK
jgi:hypothetical protein